MEETVPDVVPVSIKPKKVYGLRKEVVGNIKFSCNDEIIFPVETVLVFQHYKTFKQRFLRLPEYTIPAVIAINPTRRLLAIVEITTFTSIVTNIAVYDTITLKKRRSFELPDGDERQVEQLIFIQDSRGLLVLTKHPNEMLYMMLFDKQGTVSEAQIGFPNLRIRATCIAGNPQDINLVAVCGDGLLKFVSKSATGFKTSLAIKSHFSVVSMAWLSMEALLLGLKKGKLIIVENGEIKSQFNATEVDTIDMLKENEADQEETEAQRGSDTAVVKSIESVSCMTAQLKCFAYAVGNVVYYFEKVSKWAYQRIKVITLNKTIYSQELYKIKNLAIHPQNETLFVTAKHRQIYEYNLKELKAGEVRVFAKFKPFGQLIHIDEIVDIAVCSWRTIIMTASKDQSIRIWNYETEKIELVKKYQVDITVIELNTTGQFVAVAFSDQLRIMQIFMDELNIIKTYNFPRCSSVKYSFLGHLMAAAYDNLISITSVYNLDVLRTLKGHNGNVLTLAWSRDDKYVISGGAEGAIYQWDVETGERIQEIVQKGTEYRSLCCSGDPFSIYAVTGSGYLRELNNSEIVRQLECPIKKPFLDLALARSDLIMFASTDAEQLYSVQLPFLDAGGGTFTNYRFFDSAVTKIVFSYDGTLLITGSKDGTLVIWVLENIEGKVAPIDQELLSSTEVIIPRSVLKEKNDQIANLELRLVQQAAEFQYQTSQNEIFDSQQLADVHKGYCHAIEALKNRNNILEQKHIEELNKITFQIDDLKAEHREIIQKFSNQFTERMLMEYQKYTSFKKSCDEMQEQYGLGLREAAALLQDTVEAWEVDSKKKLEQREDLIQGLLQELQDIKFEYNEYCRQVSVDDEKYTMQNIIKYENYIKALQEEEIMLRGTAGVLKRKCDTTTMEFERLVEELEALDDERVKSQKTMGKLMLQIEDLRKDLIDREFAISVKENRIQEILHMNQQLEKYKQVFSHTITDLKMQIEPRECEINEKRKQITEKESQLDNLNTNNTFIEGQLKKFEEQYRQALSDLKAQRRASRNFCKTFDELNTELYHLAGKINNSKELRSGIQKLIQKYASNDALLKHITSEEQVRNEFERQRRHIEKSIEVCKEELRKKSKNKSSEDLLRENIGLLKEIEILREIGVKNARERVYLMNNLKLTKRNSAETNKKLTRTMEQIANNRMHYQYQADEIMERINKLQLENEKLRREMESYESVEN